MGIVLSTEITPPTHKALGEALLLAEEILKNIELSEVSLTVVMLKASRLARLLNDHPHQIAFQYEASGYPSTPTGVSAPVWKAAKTAGRIYKTKDKDQINERAYLESTESLERLIETCTHSLVAAVDADVSISSANPSQYVSTPFGNTIERNQLRDSIQRATLRLSSRRGFVHNYVSSKFDELRFSGIADDIFSRMRQSADDKVAQFVPQAVQKFNAIYENLASDNSEDWSNAVHSCRRILQDLADALYPARADLIKDVNGKQKTIKLGVDNYINRLIAYIQEKEDSDRFLAIVGSNLSFIGDRLDASFQAAQKGSHAIIATKLEADRYVVYTYMLVADILSLETVPQINSSDKESISKKALN